MAISSSFTGLSRTRARRCVMPEDITITGLLILGALMLLLCIAAMPRDAQPQKGPTDDLPPLVPPGARSFTRKSGLRTVGGRSAARGLPQPGRGRVLDMAGSVIGRDQVTPADRQRVFKGDAA